MAKVFKFLFVLLIGSVLMSCEKKDMESLKAKDEQELQTLLAEINQLSSSFSCNDAAEWKFTAIGQKGCGGPIAYIAYSTKLNEQQFLAKVELFTQKQKAYNLKWDVVSDCMAIIPPKSVSCVDGKPKFFY